MKKITKGILGSRYSTTKLTDADIRNIRRKYDEGQLDAQTAREMAQIYNISTAGLRRVARRDSFQWVAEAPSESEMELRIQESLKQMHILEAQRREEESKALESLQTPPNSECPYPMEQWTDIEKQMYAYMKTIPQQAIGWY